MNEVFICALVGILGVLFHSVVKCNSLQKDARLANMAFDPVKDYLLKDYLGITASFLSVFVWIFLFNEVVEHYPKLQGFIRTSFFVMGAIGSWALQILLSRAKQSIRSVVDEKTNIADNKAE